MTWMTCPCSLTRRVTDQNLREDTDRWPWYPACRVPRGTISAHVPLLYSVCTQEVQMFSNPSGSETMATMAAGDKRVWPLLGGLESRLFSACQMQDTWT